MALKWWLSRHRHVLVLKELRAKGDRRSNHHTTSKLHQQVCTHKEADRGTISHDGAFKLLEGEGPSPQERHTEAMRKDKGITRYTASKLLVIGIISNELDSFCLLSGEIIRLASIAMIDRFGFTW